MELNNNIKKLRQLSSLSQKEFADILGIRSNVLSNWEQGIAKPDIQVILQIADYFGIPVVELVNGKIPNDYDFNNKENNIAKAKPTNNANEGIPLITAAAMAGYFKGEDKVLEYECERFIVPTFKEAEFLIPVKGGSMYPKYSSGDIIACKKLTMDAFFQWNKVYVLDTDQGALIKRINKGSTDEKLLIVSDNPLYEPFELHRSNIYGIAIVIGVIRLE